MMILNLLHPDELRSAVATRVRGAPGCDQPAAARNGYVKVLSNVSIMTQFANVISCSVLLLLSQPLWFPFLKELNAAARRHGHPAFDVKFIKAIMTKIACWLTRMTEKQYKDALAHRNPKPGTDLRKAMLKRFSLFHSSKTDANGAPVEHEDAPLVGPLSMELLKTMYEPFEASEAVQEVIGWVRPLRSLEHLPPEAI